MRRREFTLLLGGAMTAARGLRAQQKAMPVIGFLSSTSPGPFAPMVAAFRQGLSETGYVEGQNLAIEYRWAEFQYDRLPALATDLIARKVEVIATNGDPLAVRAAKNANSTIPIVFSAISPGRDPAGRQSRPAGRQRHRRQPDEHRADAQAARAVVRAGSAGRSDRPVGEPGQSAD